MSETKKPQRGTACTQEQLADFDLPKGYSNDILAEGTPGKNEQGEAVNYLTKLHVVKPNGRVACDCPINPASILVYPQVRTPKDFRHLYCESSELYMRTEVARLLNESTGQPAGR